MTWETQEVLLTQDARLRWFVGFATLATYFFHGWVNTVYPAASRQHAWNNRNKTWILLATIAATGAAAFLGWPYRDHPLPFILVATAAFLYTAPNLPYPPFRHLQRIVMGKTVYLALVWTMVTTLLPYWLGDTEAPERYWWFLGHRFFLLLAICILFDQRDRQTDRDKGVKTMATMAGEHTVRQVFLMSLILSGVMAIGIQASVVNPWLVPVLILLPQFRLAQSHRHDAYYAIFLDGMMAGTAVMQGLMTLVILK